LSQKVLSLWPLPGGVDSYFNTLLVCLEFVGKNNPDRSALRKWFVNTYRLTGKKTVDGYIYVVEAILHLIREENGGFSLTNDGKDVLETKSKSKMFDILNLRVAGISELLALLRDKPHLEDELHESLQSRLASQGARWKTKAQTVFRIHWLKNLGMISKAGRSIALSEMGRSKLTGDEKPSSKFSPRELATHRKLGKVRIVQAMFRDGKWFYEVEKIEP